MEPDPDEHTLEFLLAFDGRVHWYEQGYWVKFEIRRVQASPERSHGLRYSFTLHDPQGKRLIGYDNVHRIRTRKGRTIEADHWHHSQNDPGTPYSFKDATTLVGDFLDEVERVLIGRGVPVTVIETSKKERNP
jgi:hypothetical protein